MRFAEKAKRFVSISMIVCMFVLAFGIMTAYAYSYVKFGEGFGLGPYASYSSYTKISIAKKWDGRLGQDEHSGVVINYSAGSVEDSIVLSKENEWNSGEFKVKTENGSVIFSISEDPVPDGYTSIYVVDCEKTYSLYNDEEEEESGSGESKANEETQPSEEETTAGSDDNKDVSKVASENGEANESESGTEEANESEPETEEANEPASDESNLNESDPEEESDGNTQVDDTEKESEPAEEESGSDVAEEETQKNSSLTEEEETVTYKKESVLSFGGLSIVSMSVDTSSNLDDSSSSNESGSDSSSSGSNDGSGSSSSDSSEGSTSNGGESSGSSNVGTDNGGSSEGGNSGADNSASNGDNSNSSETGSNVSDESDNESSNENNDTTAGENGNDTSEKNEIADAPNHTENPDNSGEDNTQEESTSDKTNNEQSGAVNNQEDEVADSQAPADNNLGSVSGSQGGSGSSGSGSGTGSPKEETEKKDEEEDGIDALDGELEVEVPLPAKARTGKNGILSVKLDDDMLKEMASYKYFTVQLMQDEELYGSEINLLEEKEHTWEGLPLFDGDSEHEYKLKTNFSFSVEANEQFSLPDDADVKITVINTRLEIGKTVAGSAADTNQEFSFTITLQDEEGNALKDCEYGGSKEGTISSGDTITLKHGEFIFVKDLPKGTKWRVEEAETDYTSEVKFIDEKTMKIAVANATENSESEIKIGENFAEGSIGENSSNIQFTNTKNGGGSNGGGGNGGGGGGGGGRSGGSTPNPEPQPEEIIELPEEEVPLAAFMPELPKTGDDSRTVLYLVLCLASLGSAVLLTVSQCRRNGR